MKHRLYTSFSSTCLPQKIKGYKNLAPKNCNRSPMKKGVCYGSNIPKKLKKILFSFKTAGIGKNKLYIK